MTCHDAVEPSRSLQFLGGSWMPWRGTVLQHAYVYMVPSLHPILPCCYYPANQPLYQAEHRAIPTSWKDSVCASLRRMHLAHTAARLCCPTTREALSLFHDIAMQHQTPGVRLRKRQVLASSTR